MLLLQSASHTSIFLLFLATLFTSLSAQSITSISGCTLNANNRTSNCVPSTRISIVGQSFLTTGGGRRLTITVADVACNNAQYFTSTLLTCQLPAVPVSGVHGEWLSVTAFWRDSNQTQPFAGVSYAVLSSSSSSSSSSARSSSSRSSLSTAASRSSSSTSAARISSSTSTRSITSSTPVTTTPVISTIRGCVNVGIYTTDCTYYSNLTITGQYFGTRPGQVRIDSNRPAPIVSWSTTTIVFNLPTVQYEPHKLLSVRVETVDNARSLIFNGVSYTAIPPVVTGLRWAGGNGSTIRVSPESTITVIGSSFPTSGTTYTIVLNKTSSGKGQQYLSATVASFYELVATLPSNINSDVRRNVPLPLTIVTYYVNSAPFTPGVVILSSAAVPSSSSSSTGMSAPQPVISGISGCEDDGDRTRNCLLMQSIPLTLTGRNFPITSPDRVYIGNNAGNALCTVAHYTGSNVICTTPSSVSFMINQVYQIWIVWKGGVNATMYGIWFTDHLAAPTVSAVMGAGCVWNGSVAYNCQRGSSNIGNNWLTITGTHFPLYLQPEITIGGSNCTMRTSNRISNRLDCRVTNMSLPANTVLPLRINFNVPNKPEASTQSLDYYIVAFRTPYQPSSTAAAGGGGGDGVVGSTKLSLEDELIIILLSATSGVLLLLAVIFGITYRRLRAARSQHTSIDGPWNEMVGGDGAAAARGFRMDDDQLERPVVATPYVPLVAQQLGAAGGGGGGDGRGGGGGDGEWESWEGIPSPR